MFTINYLKSNRCQFEIIAQHKQYDGCINTPWKYLQNKPVTIHLKLDILYNTLIK